jgi:hypothetical protein
MKPQQLPLFYLPPDEGETQLTGNISKNDDGSYFAEIAGWWVGHGSTADAAIKNAVLAYTNEMEAMGC